MGKAVDETPKIVRRKIRCLNYFHSDTYCCCWTSIMGWRVPSIFHVVCLERSVSGSHHLRCKCGSTGAKGRAHLISEALASSRHGLQRLFCSKWHGTSVCEHFLMKRLTIEVPHEVKPNDVQRLCYFEHYIIECVVSFPGLKCRTVKGRRSSLDFVSKEMRNLLKITAWRLWSSKRIGKLSTWLKLDCNYRYTSYRGEHCVQSLAFVYIFFFPCGNWSSQFISESMTQYQWPVTVCSFLDDTFISLSLEFLKPKATIITSTGRDHSVLEQIIWRLLQSKNFALAL